MGAALLTKNTTKAIMCSEYDMLPSSSVEYCVYISKPTLQHHLPVTSEPSTWLSKYVDNVNMHSSEPFPE